MLFFSKLFYPLQTSGRQQCDRVISGLEVTLFYLFLLINNRLSCTVCTSALLLQLTENRFVFQELKAKYSPLFHAFHWILQRHNLAQ